MIIFRAPEGDDKVVKYWKYMDHGKPIWGSKKSATDFAPHLYETAMRQVQCLEPLRKIGLMNRGDRFINPLTPKKEPKKKAKKA